MIPRKLHHRITELLQEFRIVYLTGSRQAGKTTLAKEVADATGMRYFTLDDQSLREVANSDPQGLLASLSWMLRSLPV